LRLRILFLPIAAVVIAGLCAYRLTRPAKPVAVVMPGPPRALPPRGWELPDQDFRLVKFDRFLGRHPVVVLFFDGRRPPEEDSLLVWLRDHATAVYDAGWRIIAISTANPADIRKSAERTSIAWEFPVLTDMRLRDPAPHPVHHLWSRVDRQTGELQPGLFLVDRAGNIPYENGRPLPESEPGRRLKELIAE
jgi:peroxiredoxin